MGFDSRLAQKLFDTASVLETLYMCVCVFLVFFFFRYITWIDSLEIE